MDQQCTVELNAREADMIAKVLLQARRGNLGWVAYSAAELSQVRRKVMNAFGLSHAEPVPGPIHGHKVEVEQRRTGSGS